MGRTPRFSAQTALVLRELLATPSQWRYGYDLMGDTGLAAGTLYPILARLVRYGWLAAEAEPRVSGDGRPPRQHYRLTAAGRAGAREMVATAAGLESATRRR